MLAVVQHKEECAGSHVLRQGHEKRPLRFLPKAHRDRHALGHEAGIREGRQLHHPGAVGIALEQIPRHLNREPRLAATAGTKKGDEARRREEARYLLHLVLPPHEACERDREVVRDPRRLRLQTLGRLHGRGRTLEQRTKRRRDLRAPAEPTLTLFRHRARHDPVERTRKSLPDSARGRRLNHRDLVDHGESTRTLERDPPRRGLVEHDPQGEEIGSGIQYVAARLLGGHVGDGARHDARFRQMTDRCGRDGSGARGAFQTLGEAKIGDLGAT